MIAALIFVISFLTLLQFFLSYCRSLIAESLGHELSEQTREICGGVSAKKAVAGDQFQRLLQLIALCPEPGGDGLEVRAVALYFGMLGLARVFSRWALPSVTYWIEAERGACAYTAAVVLDRRIANNRMLLAQQAGR
jgi:hypothetical protein